MNKWKSVIVVVGLLAVLVGASVAGAQDAPTSPPDGQSMEGRGGFFGGEGGPGFGGRGPRGGENRGPRGNGDRLLMDAVIDATGLTPRDLMQQLMDGSTLSEIVTANGGDVQAIIDTAIASATERINQAVENGRLTQERADEMLANLEQGLTELMNGDLFARGAGIQAGRGVLHLVVEQTGLSGQEVREQLQAGGTVADILTTSGVDVNAFIADASARVEARLNVLVVDGRMTQERADELLAQFQTELNERITEPGFGIQMPESAGV